MSQGKRDGEQFPPSNRSEKRSRVDSSSTPTKNGSNTIQEQIQAAKARAAMLMAKNASLVSSSSVRPQQNTNVSTNSKESQLSIQEQFAESRRRADELLKQNKQKSTAQGIHPLLRNQQQSIAGPSSMAINFEKSNPYLTSTDDQNAEEFQSKPRRRALQFNTPGRYIRAAEEAKREAEFEALKKRIEDQAKKAKLQEISAEERLLRRMEPPGIEWWDQNFFPGKNYYEINSQFDALLQSNDSPLDRYIQHPIPIPSPMDKIVVVAKGVMLTKKEQKKMRRLRRKAELEDKQDRIKMGLQPPDPPKVKLSNMMRIFGSEAAADPTKVEARIRREVAARKEMHDKINNERKLTIEQKHEKIQVKKEKDLKAGVHTLVFKVKHLVSPSHKFKVRKNALQLDLTGITLFGKDYAIVIVEGGQKALKFYKHLMMSRINWQIPGQPKDDNDNEQGTPASEVTTTKSYEDLSFIDWQNNYCKILFEGPIRQKNFQSGFRAFPCETDLDAKERLGANLSSYWDLAKRDEDVQGSDDDDLYKI